MYEEIVKEKFKNLCKDYKSRDILVLGIESSCDETSISIVKNGREILSNVVATQIDIHARFGGVVPEVASRNHLLAIDSVLEEALKQADVTLEQIDAIAVTYGAGLVGALMVGVNYAKALAFALQIPLSLFYAHHLTFRLLALWRHLKLLLLLPLHFLKVLPV